MEAPVLDFDISQADDVVCDLCKSRTFREVTLIKRISPLLSPTGKETFAPVNTFCCSQCGHLNASFDPFAAKQ